MKLIIKPVENKHAYDCWCGAIRNYLINKDYTVVTVDLDLWDSLQVYDTTNGAVFFLKEKDSNSHHIVYVKGNTIYDNILVEEIVHYLLRYNVTYVALKIKDTYKNKRI